jgi:hypothetical protein
VSDARLLFRTGFGSGERTGRPPSLGRAFWGAAASALAVFSAVLAEDAQAEVVVQRDHDEIRVSVDNDTVGHVLEALAQSGNLRYRSAAPLDKVIGGDFSGSWGQVLSGILVGFDFAVAYRPESMEIVVFGESGAKPGAPPPTDVSPQPQTATPVSEKGRARRQSRANASAPPRPNRIRPGDVELGATLALPHGAQSRLQEGQR